MPQFDFTSPDGKSYTITGPAGSTKEQAFAKLQTQLKPAPAAPAASAAPGPDISAPAPDKDTQGALGFLKNLYGGGDAEAALSLGTGAIAKPVSDIAGLAATAHDALTGATDGDPTGFKNYVQNALTYSPRTAQGKSTLQSIGNAAGDATNSLINPIKKGVGDLAGALGGPQSVQQGLANGAGEGVQQMMNMDAPEATADLAERALPDLPPPPRKINSSTDDTLQLAKDNKFLVTPTNAQNKSGPAATIASLGGSELKLQQAMSKVNTTKTAPDLVKQDLGIAPNDELTQATINQVDQKANGAYQAVRTVGPVPITPEIKTLRAKFGVDQPPTNPNIPRAPGASPAPVGGGMDPLTLTQQPGPASAAVPGSPGVQNPTRMNPLTMTQDPDMWTTGGMLDTISQLRADARAGFKATDNPAALRDARQSYQAAGTLDTFLQKTLQDKGVPQLASAYTAARTMKAKIASVRDAFNPNTGTIDPQSLVKDMNNGVPLSGGLLTIAKVADAFPKVMQAPERLPSTGGMTGVDALMAAHGAVTGRLGDAAMGFARPIARAVVSSPGAQAKMVAGQQALTPNLARQAANVGNSLGMGALSAVPAMQALASQQPRQQP